MIRTRSLNRTEEHFLNEALRYYKNYKKDMEVVFIHEVWIIYEAYKKAGRSSVGFELIYWDDDRPTSSSKHPPLSDYQQRQAVIHENQHQRSIAEKQSLIQRGLYKFSCSDY
jgi:hypothetical protein